MRWIVILFLLAYGPFAFATYVVTGPVQGESCSGIGIKLCKWERVDAVADTKGNLYELPKYYTDVTSYENGSCTLKAKSTGGGPVSWLVNAINGATYLQASGSGYRELDLERLAFRCEKR